MAEFHGPTAVIGKNSTGHYVDLEHNYLTNVEWIAKAKNGTFLPNTNVAEALGAQVHTNNQEGEFVLMALQTNAGAAHTSKIIVSGESIASSYKNMFNQLGEYEIPHNDYFIVHNSFQWLAPMNLRPTIPNVHLLAPENNYKTAGLVDVSWMVPEFHSPTYKFDVYVNGSIEESTVGYAASLNLTTGVYEVFVKEETLQGFVGRSITVLVYVDIDKPVVTITSPIANAAINTTSVKVDWTATDVGQGVASYEVVVDGTSKTNTTATTYTVTGLSLGQHTITVKAYDALGNVGEASVTVTIVEPTTATSKSGGGIPGFEMLFLVAGLFAVYAYKKRNFTK